MKRILVWFRRDLRLYDNPALSWALAQGAAVQPVYLHSPGEEAPWAPGAASRWWLHHSLQALERRLSARGLTLACFEGEALDLLPRLAAEGGFDAVAGNRLYEPHLARRDDALSEGLAGRGMEMRWFDSSLLFPPGEIRTQQGGAYRVFTPFWRNARAQLETLAGEPAGVGLPRGRWRACDGFPGGRVADLGLLDSHRWHEKLHAYWTPGEEAARSRLERFLEHGLGSYREAREFPAVNGSSRLSPHLHFGEITPRAIVGALMPQLLGVQGAAAASIECFLSELGWREFAHHLLWHLPQSSHQSMNPRFEDSFWIRDDEALRAWQQGRTGLPLIDAGMRELWETGWMHNRVRMLVGSFLTKNLGIHWRAGAHWFWDTLVDADLASNSLGWQWIAGCGADAAPYFRIFNPETQAAKYDPDRAYLGRWLRGRGDGAPITDLAESRRLALARYRELTRPG